MIALRKSLPWVASLFVHLAILQIPLQLLSLSPPAAREERRVDLIFEGEAAKTPVRGTRVSSPLDSSPLPAASIAAVEVPLEASRSAVAVLPQEEPLSIRPASDLGGIKADAEPLRGSQFASPQEVLADMTASEPAFLTPTPEVPAAPAAPAVESGAAGEPKIEWEGEPRKPVHQQYPQFPRVLQLSGQEGECEAKITVSPAGNVTRVEIAKSSGYPEIDASVLATIRGWLFSRANNAKDAVGIVRLRFRLERGD